MSNLKLHKTLAMDNDFIHEKLFTRLTFNPGLALIGFRTTRPWLNNIIKCINQNKNDLFLFGDINIDFMKVNSHPETDEYLNMLFSHGLLPIGTKPIRITSHTSTLIDHIYIPTRLSLTLLLV